MGNVSQVLIARQKEDNECMRGLEGKQKGKEGRKKQEGDKRNEKDNNETKEERSKLWI